MLAMSKREENHSAEVIGEVRWGRRKAKSSRYRRGREGERKVVAVVHFNNSEEWRRHNQYDSGQGESIK